MKFDKLTGLRGFAALVVFISHAGNAGFLHSAFGHGLGQVGVMIFFVLSGFLMAYLYMEKPLTRANFRTYCLARTGRVFPLYFAVIAISIVISSYIYPEFRYSFTSTPQLLMTLFFVEAPYELWTIPVEVQFYAVFVLFWLLYFKKTPYKIMLPLALLTMVPTAILVPIYKQVPNIVSSYAFAFFIGICTSVLYKNGQLDRIPRQVINWAGLPILLLVFVNLPDLRREFGLTFSKSAYALTWLDPITWFIVYSLFICALLNSSSLKLLESRICIFLGEISYGFYLIHRPIMEWSSDVIESGPAGLLISAILTTAISAASFYCFERKISQAIRNNNTST